jgi:peptide/nickel transport system ATP-binding protein/oligopeptide transport system ATP-binding protein
MALLKISDLSISFHGDGGKISIIEDVSFDVGAGEVVGLVGESGCGKSVTAMSIMRLLPPGISTIEKGTVELEGRGLLELDEASMCTARGDRMGMVFQEPMTSLNPTYTIGFQLMEALRLHRPLGPAAARETATEMLHLVGVSAPERRLEQYAHELSGGLRQRVMIAMALICRPSLLIADEPTTALDVTVQAQILNLLVDLRSGLGLSYLFISHDLAVIKNICDTIAVMYLGEIVEIGPAERIFSSSKHPYTEALISAIPEPVPGRKRIVLSGDVSSPENPPPGCPFHPRCPRAFEPCSTGTPVRSTTGHGDRAHGVSCHLHA